MRYQVTIVGGGTTGVCAALAAARGGARVLLIDGNGFLGGNASNGLSWLGFHTLEGKPIIGGIPKEIITILQESGGATEFRFDPICGSCVGVDPTYLKMTLQQMVRESGIDLRLHTFLYKAVCTDGIWQLSVCDKSGAHTIETDILIDCTDNADAACSAGVPFDFGRSSDGQPQVSSSIIRVGNIDMDRFCAYFKDHPDQLRPFPLTREEQRRLVDGMRSAPIFVLGAFEQIISRAIADGVDYPRSRLIGTGNALTGELTLVASRVENVHPEDCAGYTDAEMEGLDQTKGIMRLLREYLPGCENARLIGSGHTIGLRETRHLRGIYHMTAEDLLKGRDFEDTIAHGAYHLDIHTPDNNGLETRKSTPYSIPFRICRTDRYNNLLVAGRCVSADQDAQSSLRVIPILGAIGQACGTAAAMCAQACIPVSNVCISALQETLRRDGCII